MTSEAPKEAPFGALLGVLSLGVGVLFVAGFSYRWGYYYNFGLQHLLFSFSLQGVLICAIELLRRPAHALLTAGIAIGLLLLLQIAILVFRWATGVFKQVLRVLGAPVRKEANDAPPGAGAQLAIETLRMLALIYAGFISGHIIGWRTFQKHRVDGVSNPLPRVTLAFGRAGSPVPEPILCNRTVIPERVFVGSAATLKRFDEGCIMLEKPKESRDPLDMTRLTRTQSARRSNVSPRPPDALGSHSSASSRPRSPPSAKRSTR